MSPKLRSLIIPLAAALLACAAGALASPLAASGPAPSEPAACAGLSDRDREALARLPRELIEDVQPLYDAFVVPFMESSTSGPQQVERTLRGATVSVRPAPGLSPERLQRVVECALATASPWPRLPAGTVASVRSGGDRFLVELRGPGTEAGHVLETARQLKP